MNIDDYLKHTYEPMERSVFGVPGKCSTGHGDFLFLDFLLCQRPLWRNIVELGTGSGLTTLYIGMCAACRCGRLATYDKRFTTAWAWSSLWPDCVTQKIEDVLTTKSKNVVADIERPGTFLICDNGKKIQEANMYAPHLEEGSGFAVHDWGHEIRLSDIHEMLQREGFVPLFHEEAEAMQSKLRAWEKR